MFVEFESRQSVSNIFRASLVRSREQVKERKLRSDGFKRITVKFRGEKNERMSEEIRFQSSFIFNQRIEMQRVTLPSKNHVL